ncbi:MAG: EF-hand domain-containing protein [Sedimentitalea sp.]
MKQITVTGLSVIAALALGVTAVVAKDRGKDRGMGHNISFETLDTDSSGEISKAELAQTGTARFAATDTNSDGLLSRDEMLAAAQARNEERVDHMLERMDADGDGAISESELPKRRNAARMFDRIDADGSGGISAEEFAQLRERMGRRRAKN